MMAISSYYNQAELLVRDYIFSPSYIPYTSIIGGILMCKLCYDLTQLISSFYLKRYAGLSKIQCVEWNNRGISTVHAIFITVMSIHFVFFSDLYSDDRFDGFITFRSSPLSAFTLGVSAGYFITDLGMIFWLYPSLGGMEYVIHHLISLAALLYSVLSGEGQLYTFMVLISETTTPAVNLRWYLDTAGMKRSSAYLVNGVFMFFAWLVWSPCFGDPSHRTVFLSMDMGIPRNDELFELKCLIICLEGNMFSFCIRRIIVVCYTFSHPFGFEIGVARILLFMYVFYHIYLHYDQLKQMHTFGYLSILIIPCVLTIMNLVWFWKIIKGLKKTVEKRH